MLEKTSKILNSRCKNLLYFLKKYVFCDKVQGMEVSPVCRWAVTGDTHWISILWE